jgi:hypothetical protein
MIVAPKRGVRGRQVTHRRAKADRIRLIGALRHFRSPYFPGN